jgi:hypothetical protein
MEKICGCGSKMTMRLRSLVFAKKVSILNVPVMNCTKCRHSEVLADCAQQLITLLRGLGSQPAEQHIWYNEVHELAYILYEASKAKKQNRSMHDIAKDRINELLDLLLLSRALGDDAWVADIETRLGQITQSECVYNNVISNN